jgi:AcrR family transcriptional regulator
MPVRTSHRRGEIVAASRDLLEAGGPGALTMRAVAAQLNIRAASLYKHVSDKAELEAALIADAFVETAAEFRRAVARSDADPLVALGRAYRRWALAHPHLYELMSNRALDRDRGLRRRH